MTYYLCNNCGNKEYFNARYDVTEWRVERNIIGGDGELYDYDDSECVDSETTDGPYAITCRECASADIGEFDDETERDEESRKIIQQNSIPDKVDDWKNELGG